MRTKRVLLGLIGLYMVYIQANVAQAQTLGVTLPPALNFASSPNPVGSGARAQGKGLAFIAVADDATAASHNPAGLAQLQLPEFSLVISSALRVEDQDVQRAMTVVENQTLSSFDINYFSVTLPFGIQPYPSSNTKSWYPSWVFSLNIQRLFDFRSETDTSSFFDNDPKVSGLQIIHTQQTGGLYAISPSVGAQITPTLSIGVALNFWPRFLNNGWEQKVDVSSTGSVISGNRVIPFTAQGRIKERFEFEGFNVTLGFLWQHRRQNRTVSIGGVLRSPFTAKVKRTHTSSLRVNFAAQPEPALEQGHFSETLDLDMPLSYGLGVSIRFSDAWTLSLDVSRIHWSDFQLEMSRQESYIVDNGAPAGKGRRVLAGEADDTTSVRLGLEYLWIFPRVLVPVRAGAFYDPEPGNTGTDDLFGLSFGLGLNTDKWLFDMAYTFRTGVVSGSATDTSIRQHEILASVIHRFGQEGSR